MTSHPDPFNGAAVSPFSFDVAAWEFFSVLCFGGALHILQREQFIDPENLAGYISTWQIHSAYIPPALLADLRRHLRHSEWSLHRLLVGVESIRQGLLQDYRDLAGDSTFHIINGYGPTEAAICSSFHVFQEAVERDGNTPIGRPIANTRIYILDANLHPLPPGIPGELCIAGAGLARGYLNRPDLTTEKFIELKIFGKTERIYRTGDLARWRTDGNLEYLGRMDHQVKLRGFRIELGEIEAALTKHESVSEAVVVLHEREGNKSLAAYLTVSADADMDAAALTAELRVFLKESLPEYMIPASFTVLEKLPFTPNGKIDRKNLPEPDEQFSHASRMPPRDITELRLLGLWQEVLGTDAPGIHDSFFDSGGHSLLAVRLMGRIQKEFGIRLPLSLLFQHPTVARLAAHLREPKPDTTAWSTCIRVSDRGDEPPIYLLPGAVGSVLYLQPLTAALGGEQPIYVLQTPGLHGEAPVPEKVEDLAAAHIAALRREQPRGPYRLIGHSSGGRAAFEMARRLEEQGECVAFLGILDTNAPDPEQPAQENEDSDEYWLWNLALVFGELIGRDLDITSEELRALNNSEAALNRTLEAFLRHELLAPDADAEQLKCWMQVYRASVLGHSGYVGGRVNCPVHLFRAQERLAAAGAEEMPEDNRPDWGWSDCTQAKAVEISVPGNHASMMALPHVRHLADAIRPFLRETK
ncbi:MAG: AMP-binding protein [Candidatus Electrothrix aestuarii]|uniref:AMP-binding protein n=1 Tax=Candidatus Electrothrix aestuarii TaxID=3062594 RepID=A0AAU8M0W6_9BACT